MTMRNVKRGLLWGLVLISVGSLIFTPYEALLDSAIAVLPWLAPGVIVTEILFVLGLLVMAGALGVKTRNPMRLRRELKDILRATTKTRTFWIGFWINAAGAVGSALFIGAGIVIALPISSWGLASVLLVDLMATVAIRQWAVRSHVRERDSL